MRFLIDGWEFDLSNDSSNIVDAFIFDEKDRSKSTFHGAPMKAVDLIIELQNMYIFIEAKRYDNPGEFIHTSKQINVEGESRRTNAKTWLIEYLKYKYRDTFIYRYAENKIDKPITYLCLLNFDKALNLQIMNNLCQQLPIKNTPERWQNEIVNQCYVLNQAQWNEKFPKWQVIDINTI